MRRAMSCWNLDDFVTVEASHFIVISHDLFNKINVLIPFFVIIQYDMSLNERCLLIFYI